MCFPHLPGLGPLCPRCYHFRPCSFLTFLRFNNFSALSLIFHPLCLLYPICTLFAWWLCCGTQKRSCLFCILFKPVESLLDFLLGFHFAMAIVHVGLADCTFWYIIIFTMAGKRLWGLLSSRFSRLLSSRKGGLCLRSSRPSRLWSFLDLGLQILRCLSRLRWHWRWWLYPPGWRLLQMLLQAPARTFAAAATFFKAIFFFVWIEGGILTKKSHSHHFPSRRLANTVLRRVVNFQVTWQYTLAPGFGMRPKVLAASLHSLQPCVPQLSPVTSHISKKQKTSV